MSFIKTYRYDVIMSSFYTFLMLDYAGVAVFAATGVLSASRKQLDIVGFIFLASITGIGGGTLRDVILGKLPVFWIQQPVFILVCVIVAVMAFFTPHLVESRYRLLLWLDALGLASYCVMSMQIDKGISVSISVSLAFALRAAALKFDWTTLRYRSKEGRKIK